MLRYKYDRTIDLLGAVDLLNWQVEDGKLGFAIEAILPHQKSSKEKAGHDLLRIS